MSYLVRQRVFCVGEWGWVCVGECGWVCGVGECGWVCGVGSVGECVVWVVWVSEGECVVWVVWVWESEGEWVSVGSVGGVSEWVVMVKMDKGDWGWVGTKWEGAWSGGWGTHTYRLEGQRSWQSPPMPVPSSSVGPRGIHRRWDVRHEDSHRDQRSESRGDQREKKGHNMAVPWRNWRLFFCHAWSTVLLHFIKGRAQMCFIDAGLSDSLCSRMSRTLKVIQCFEYSASNVVMWSKYAME